MNELPPGVRIARLAARPPSADEHPSDLEIQARFAAMGAQRDRAQTEAIMQAGRIAVLEAELEALRAQIVEAQRAATAAAQQTAAPGNGVENPKPRRRAESPPPSTAP